MKEKLNCILLIDDDTTDNFFHKKVITEMKIVEKIEVAPDGESGLKWLNRENQPAPEIIFLDINMPRMNGWEFLEEYSKLDPSKKAKAIVVMLSSSSSNEEKDKAARFPDIIGFNSKPLTEKSINEILIKHF
jgi:CheY-like chemotaxis protein